VTPDPYPDLVATELLEAAGGADDGTPGEPPELSEADSRLLDALTRPQPAVVTAVEDEPRTVRAARDDRVAPVRPAGARSALTPVFQEPAD
jgi:hypothetical protein